MKKMIKRIIPENDVPAYFNKLHNISGKVASKFYNDAETPVQIILGPIGSGKTFVLQMKIIRLACEQIPVPRVNEEIIGRGSKRIVIDEETLTSYFKVKVVGKSLIDIEQTLFPALTKMFGGYGNIVKSDYTKPFKIYFESPLFENTVVEILFAFDIARSVALGSEGGKEYSLIWISEFCLKDDESGFMALSELKSRIRGIPDILNIHIKHRENPEFLEAVEYVNNRSVKVLSDMNTPFESWKSWLLGLSPIPRSIDKLYRESIESAIDYWGIYAQKPAWYFNKKEQKFIENKDSENRENLPIDYYHSAGVHPFKMKKDFCCIPTRESTGDRVFHNLQDGHTDVSIEFPKDGILYIAVDYGYKGNGAVFAFEEDGILKILDEYASTNETTQNFLDAVYIKAKVYKPRKIICIDDPTSAHSKGIGRQSEFSNRELAEKKFELVYGAATNDWPPRINSVNNILVRMNSRGFLQLSIHPVCFLVLEGLEGEYTYGKDGKPDKNCKTSDVMDALQYICMDIGARISSDIDKYVNPIKNLKEQFDEHERILKGTTKKDEIFLNTGSLL